MASAGESRAREPAQQITGAGLRFGQRAELKMARAPFLRVRWSCPPRHARAKTAFFTARRLYSAAVGDALILFYSENACKRNRDGGNSKRLCDL